MVGVPAHGDADCVRLFQAVGAFRREERHRVLRTALFGQGGGFSARVQVALPRHRVQRDHDRSRDARRDQDRAGALRRRPVDGDRGHVGRVGRLCGAGRIPWRDLHGLLPVHRDHGRRGGGHVLRGQPSGRGRVLEDDGASRRAGASVVLPLVGHARRVRGRVRDPGGDPVVERVVPGQRTGRRRLYRAAHALREERGTLRGRVDPLPGGELRDPSVALVPDGLRFAHRVPRP